MNNGFVRKLPGLRAGESLSEVSREPLLVALKRALCAGFCSGIRFCQDSFDHGFIVA
jgi:hypothetical protein